MTRRSATAFYCVSSELYFLGAVGLVNSLRLQGHDEPIYLLDCGLTQEHRELLAREVDDRPRPRVHPALPAEDDRAARRIPPRRWS